MNPVFIFIVIGIVVVGGVLFFATNQDEAIQGEVPIMSPTPEPEASPISEGDLGPTLTPTPTPTPTPKPKNIFTPTPKITSIPISTPTPQPTKAPGPYDDFAKCLTQKGVKMYGASWCGHCISQKAMFGESVEHLPYIECATAGGGQTAVCAEAQITAYPTWIFQDSKRAMGELSFEKISEYSGCIFKN